MKIPENVKTIIEPFVGQGDLLKYLGENVKKTKKVIIEAYDIDPKYENTIQRDTLKNPPDYLDKFVLTNPPYLARNKNKDKEDKELYNRYKCNDLYKCFMCQLIENVCDGGILIIPLNFISSIRKSDVDLRKRFLNKYTIHLINIFEERVFEDTSYAVCSMQFSKNNDSVKQNDIVSEYIEISIYPSMKTLNVKLTSENNYTIGGEIYNLPLNTLIQRATTKTKEEKNTGKTEENTGKMTNILLKCIDDSLTNQLGFKVVNDDELFIDETPNLSARSYATLVINKDVSLEEQRVLVERMNEYLKTQREKYNSLFLSNYRESNTIARKRISFDLAFRICNYFLI